MTTRTQPKARSRTQSVKGMKCISPEKWARLKPLARELIADIVDLLINDAEATKIEAVIQGGKYGTEYFLGTDRPHEAALITFDPAPWIGPINPQARQP